MVALLLFGCSWGLTWEQPFLLFEVVEMAEIYQNTDNTTISGVYNTYDLTKYSTIDLDYSVSRSFKGTLKGLWVYLSSAANNAASISVIITTDTTGDEILIPSTESAISFGLTTATSGSASFLINQSLILRDQESIYIFCKTDHGTVQIDKVVLSWES